ncbi:MAG: hypothetical protein ACOC21_03840 [Halanaerobiales bacterium]
MDTKKIVILDNEVEAKLMEEVLEEEGIPFVIHSYVNGPYDGIWKYQRGWGHIEARPEYENKIIELYEKVCSGESE